MLGCACDVGIAGCSWGDADTVPAAVSDGGLCEFASEAMFELRVSSIFVVDCSASLRALANAFEAGLTCART